MGGILLAGTIDVRVDHTRTNATVRVDADTKFNVSRQAIIRPRFVEREVEDVGETGGRGPAGFQAARADSLIFPAARQPGAGNLIRVDIALDLRLAAGLAGDSVLHLEFPGQANPFLFTRGAQSAIERDPPR